MNPLSKFATCLGSTVAAAALTVGMTLAATPADAAEYTFSFTSNAGALSGQVVAVTIDLPTIADGGSGTAAAASLILATFPAALLPLPEGNVVTSWLNQIANSFTVTNGAITAYTFAALSGPTGGVGDLLCMNSGSDVFGGDRGCPTSFNYLGQVGNAGWNSDGPQGITFTAIAAVPEPATLAILGGGLLGLAGVRARRRAA